MARLPTSLPAAPDAPNAGLTVTCELPATSALPDVDTGVRRPPRRARFLRLVRVFVSSPGDLEQERKDVADVVAQVGEMPQIARRFQLRAHLWERRTPPLVGQAPQTSIAEHMVRPDECEIFVLLLGARLGTPTLDPDTGVPHPSGTEYELVTAYRHFRRWGRPAIVMYRASETSCSDPTERERLRAFLAGFVGPAARFKGFAPTEFSNRAVLRDVFSRDLAALVDRFDRRERWWRMIRLLAAAIMGVTIGGLAFFGWAKTEAVRQVNALIDSGLENSAYAIDRAAIWAPVSRYLGEVGGRGIEPIIARMSDPAVGDGPDQAGTAALVNALVLVARRGEQKQVCRGLLDVFSGANERAKYRKSTHRIVLERGLGQLACKEQDRILCDYLARLGPENFLDLPDSLADILAAAERILGASRAETCWERRSQP